MSTDGIVPTVGVLIFRGSEVLLVCHGKKAKQQTGVYGLPGGVVESGEIMMEAAVRELEEETGLKAKPEELLEIKKNWAARIQRKNETKTYSYKVFLCTGFSGDLQEAPDKTIPEWVPVSNLPQYNLLPNVADAVREGLKYRSRFS